MASAQSLLGLVNQLQTMEASFCDVLMEAALKLASLTGQYTILWDHYPLFSGPVLAYMMQSSSKFISN